MEIREPSYARTSDGVYVAYQLIGDGPIDIAFQTSWLGNVEVPLEWEGSARFIDELASVGRVILHDRRGTGLSTRNVPAPDLETRVGDLLTVLDAVNAERPVLVGGTDSGAVHALLASVKPERTSSLIWMDPQARAVRAPGYPWGVEEEDVDDLIREMTRNWGTSEGARAWFGAGDLQPADDAFISHWARASRLWLTPDAAREHQRIWFETDVRGILPSVSISVLLLATEWNREEMQFVASLLPRCETATFSGTDFFFDVDTNEVFSTIRRFAGVPLPPHEFERVLSTVLFTDIVDSTKKQAELGDRGWKSLVLRHHAIVRQSLDRWGGVENDTAGDGFYATFEGPGRAMRCAKEIAEQVRPLGLEVRIGIHTGECERIDDKVGGIAVTIGKRISALARPSEILVSQTVKDITAGGGFLLEAAGEHELKGIPDSWRLYRVVG